MLRSDRRPLWLEINDERNSVNQNIKTEPAERVALVQKHIVYVSKVVLRDQSDVKTLGKKQYTITENMPVCLKEHSSEVG